jgi:hypothetical protein
MLFRSRTELVGCVRVTNARIHIITGTSELDRREETKPAAATRDQDRAHPVLLPT